VARHGGAHAAAVGGAAAHFERALAAGHEEGPLRPAVRRACGTKRPAALDHQAAMDTAWHDVHGMYLLHLLRIG
jgi:hypothetical protein